MTDFMFHCVTGLPRSGTTLLTNCLHQNPRFQAGSSSCISVAMATLSAFISEQGEFRSSLAMDKEGTENRVRSLLRGMVKNWYYAVDRPVVFDKSRSWAHNADMLRDLFPEAKIIAMIRDPRDVFASIEKQHQKNPTLDMEPNLAKRTVFHRVKTFCGPDGMLGLPLAGVENAVQCQLPNVIVVKYEDFALGPEAVMRGIYDSIGEEWFPHDFNNVENVSQELDALWLNKFPHKGSGKVESIDTERSRWVPQIVDREISNCFRSFMGHFGYV